MTVRESLNNYAGINAEEGGIGGGIMPTTEDMPPNHVTIYIQVDGLQAYLDKAECLGGKTILPPILIADDIGSCAMSNDPSGNCIGLYSYWRVTNPLSRPDPSANLTPYSLIRCGSHRDI